MLTVVGLGDANSQLSCVFMSVRVEPGCGEDLQQLGCDSDTGTAAPLAAL